MMKSVFSSYNVTLREICFYVCISIKVHFENRMFSIIQNVKFNKCQNEFQKTLTKDLNNIRSEDKVLVSADKTTNFYKLDAPSYDKLLDNAITKSYKKANANRLLPI